MQACVLGLAAPVARPAAVVARRPARPAHVAAASSDGMSWLSQQAADVEAAAGAEAAAAAAAALDDSKASSVGLGLHIRGRTAFKEGATDEDDPARFFFHRALKQAAVAGAFRTAEQVVEEMAANGYVPGPRAYHALVLSHVKARDAAGALGAIRRCWDAGTTPLPETYAAVVAAHIAEGDLDTAEAVCASNRRAGVDCSKSWQQLVAALLQAGQRDKAMEMLGQGQAEGLVPSEEVYAALIEQMCGQGDVDGALELLGIMMEQDMTPGLPHYLPLITASAARDDVGVASMLLDQLLTAHPFQAGMLPACDSVLEAQMRVCETMEEAGVYLRAMKAVLSGNRVQPTRRFFAAQMAAAVRLRDMQSAMQAFRALRGSVAGPLLGLNEELLGQLLLELSHADLPADLYEVISAMARDGRSSMPDVALQPDEHGCTVLGSWVRQRLQQQPAGDGEGPRTSIFLGTRGITEWDGVPIDNVLLCVVDRATSAPMPVSKMGVKELRAELAVRRAPLTGNKKDLIKRLQKLRQLDGTRSTPLQRLRLESKGDSGKRVSVIVTDDDWGEGRMQDLELYESEKEARELPLQEEEEGEGAPEWEAEEEAEPTMAARRQSAEEEGDDELDEWTTAQMNSSAADAHYLLQSVPPFTSATAGPHDAASMLLGAVVDLKAQPTAADLQAVGDFVLTAEDVPAAVLLAAAIDRLPQPVEGAGALRERAAELCAGFDIDLTAAIDGVLKERDEEDEREILQELEQMLSQI